MKGLLKYWLIVLLSMGSFVSSSFAQGYSYVYIQGDKELPFTVQYNGEQVTRYGKNYSIIPKLEKGQIKFEVLFQESHLGKLTFQVKVPANSERSFMLVKEKNGFALFDLQNQFYIYPNNLIEEDRFEENQNVIKETLTTPTQTASNNVVNDNKKTSSKKEKIKEPTVDVAKKEKRVKAPATTTATKRNSTKESKATVAKAPKDNKEPLLKPKVKSTDTKAANEPQFIEDITLNNNHTPQAGKTVKTESSSANYKESKPAPATNTKRVDNNSKMNSPSQPALEISNSDCPTAIDEDDFTSIYYALQNQDNEEAKIKVLNKKMHYCYTTKQVQQLGKLLKSDAAKYSFFSKVYPKVSDQHHFEELVNEFKNEEYKSNFNRLLNR